MKKIITLLLLTVTAGYIFANPNPQVIFNKRMLPTTQVKLLSGNMQTWIQNSGIFNKDIRLNNTPGCEWPYGSQRFVIFTTGLTIGAMVDNQIRLASCSYNGEYFPGRCVNGVPDSSSNFKLYKIDKDAGANSDWEYWYKMVPYGAPYHDFNHNGIYDQGIDTPGVYGARNTVFICMTDGFPGSHIQNEGFSGGTAPLYAEMHLTAWGYTGGMNDLIGDMQFIKIEVINKGVNAWNSAYFGVIWDSDIGESDDDYIGYDTIRQMQYTYNADNYDGTGSPPSYGMNPPATGMIMLQGTRIKGANPVNIKVSSAISFFNASSGSIVCESDPTLPLEAYRYLKGIKKDGSAYFHPYTKKRVNKLFTGNVETFEGWTCRGYNGNPNQAVIKNCMGGDSVSTYSQIAGDVRGVISSGSDNLNINPGDTQTVYLCQLVRRIINKNNFNSVTHLQILADTARSFFSRNFPVGIQNISYDVPSNFSLSQNYPNPFNPVTKIKFDIRKSSFTEIIIYDISGKEISKPVSEFLNAGAYEISFDAAGLPSGVYFYKMKAGNFQENRKMILIK